MPEIGNLYVTIGADAAKFKSVLANVKGDLKEFAKGAEDLTRQGADFRKLSGGLDDYIGRLRAATPANAQLAASAGNVITAFEGGSLSAEEAAKQLENLRRSMGNVSTESGKTGMTFTELKSKIDLARMAIDSVIETGKKIYEFGRAGAELDYTATRFDRLAKSIGTTADVLLNDLHDATRGTLSDAELMSGAGNLMALGLAKSHDEAVRLSKVVGGLGMDMNQLVLTLTNQTTMRFDALGVSVDGFEDKVKKLKASGMSANEAFSEAFLQQAEEQLDKVGNKADETIGEFMRFEAALKNVSDTAKTNAAPALGALAGHMADVLDYQVEINDALQAGYGKGLNYRETEKAVEAYRRFNQHASEANAYLLEQYEAAKETAGVVENDYTPAIVDSTSSVERYKKAIDQANQGMEAAEDRARRMADASAELAGATKTLQDAQASWKERAGGDVASLLDEQALGAEKYEQGLSIVDEVQGTSLLSAEKLADKQEELVKQFNDGTLSAEDFKQGLIDMNDEFMPLDESIIEATNLMDDLLEKLMMFSRTWTASVEINAIAARGALEGNTSGAGTGGGVGVQERNTGIDINGNGIIGAYNGLNGFVVPPGYDERSGSPFLIAATSGEKVDIMPVGESAGTSPTVIMNVYDMTDWEQAAYRITQIQRRRRG